MKILKPFLGKGLGEKIPFLRNLFYRQFSRLMVRIKNPITISVPSGGGLINYKLYLPPNGIDYLIEESYEPLETALIIKNLKEGDTFLDIGAGIGYYTVLTSKIVGDKGKVIAFDPDPQYFQFIQKNLKENGCNNVILFQKAVLNRTGKTKFYLYDKIGRNRVEEVNHLLSDFKVRDSIEVETVRIDDLLNEKIDFIKIDIEGSQYLALEGMKNLISRNPQVKIITEFPDYKKLEFLNLLNEMGFRIYEINTSSKQLEPIASADKFIKEAKRVKIEINYLFCEKNA
ncbi:MAG: FkbM family methyltransferase [Candidatus Staskawiczbacteria bacterium]|nr:FkbM family methyltransferase [Candidatus Staskawiczbacteria bacterium]